MKITELKFAAGANASVRAYVTSKKPTEEEMLSLDAKWYGHNVQNPQNSYSEWPVQEIKPSIQPKGEVKPVSVLAFDIVLWTNEVITVFAPNYVRWNRFDEKKEDDHFSTVRGYT